MLILKCEQTGASDSRDHCASSPLSLSFLSTARSKQDDVEAARKLFAAASKKRLDYPEYLFDAWVTLEHRDGTLDTLETALATVKREMNFVNARRQRVSCYARVFRERFRASLTSIVGGCQGCSAVRSDRRIRYGAGSDHRDAFDEPACSASPIV